jgi:FkbM family methyltransferase
LFGNPAWRKRPLATAARFVTWLARKHLPFDGGRSRIRIDLQSRFGCMTYTYGIEDPDLALVGALLAPGDGFIDGGAHVGMFTLVAAARVGPSGRVLAFEPAPAARQQLRENLALSRFPWVEVREQALAERAGTRSFVAFANDAWGSSSFVPPPEFAGGDARPVETTTLDAALACLVGSRLRLVKLDLEGAEYAALQGAQTLLREVQPDFLVELEPEHLARQGASVAELVALFRQHGYHSFSVQESEAKGVWLKRMSNPGHGGARPNVFFARDLGRLARSTIAVDLSE